MTTRENLFAEFDNYALLEKYKNRAPGLPRLTGKQLADMLKTLIDSDPKEEAVQEFFEAHPRCLPRAGLFHHGLRGDIVVSKLPLHNDFVTDFAYMTKNSQEVRIFCVEIERPGKSIFRKDNHFTSDYTKAKQQVVDWNHWAQHNMREMVKYFGRLGRYLTEDFTALTMHSILIMGRRSELNTRARRERWSAEASLLPKSIDVMTYDRIIEELEMEAFMPDNVHILVCSYQDQALKVKRVVDA